MTWFRKMIMSIVQLFSITSLCLPFYSLARHCQRLDLMNGVIATQWKQQLKIWVKVHHTCWFFNGHFLGRISRWLIKHVHSEIIYAFHIVSRRTRQCLLHFIDVYFRRSVCGVIVTSSKYLRMRWKFIFRPITSAYLSLVWLRAMGWVRAKNWTAKQTYMRITNHHESFECTN